MAKIFSSLLQANMEIWAV